MNCILSIVDSLNIPYTYSTISQVLAAILAITLTFRIILSQRLKYRFPLKIVGKLSPFEIFYFFTGAILTSLSVIFLMTNFEVAQPFIIAASVIWIILLLLYYYLVMRRLSLKNLLEMSRKDDEQSLKKWGDKHHGIITKETKLILYDLSIQAADQKDFQYMEEALACLASLSDRFTYFIIRSQIGLICRQYINNSRVFEYCLDIFYRLISPIRLGVRGKLFFLMKLSLRRYIKDLKSM